LPVNVIFIEGFIESEPKIFRLVDKGPAKVGELSAAAQFIFRQIARFEFTVTVWLAIVNELASKNTSSCAVGACPYVFAPPEVVAQCVRSVQLPEFPIQ